MSEQAYEPDARAHEPPQEFKFHAMFPRDDEGPETRDIRWITLLRLLPDGTIQFCPDAFAAEDLREWSDVHRRFGGGKYRAVGRNEKRQFQAYYPGQSDWILFDGPMKPFLANPVEPPAAVKVEATAPAPAPAAPSMKEMVAEAVAAAIAVRMPVPPPAPPGPSAAEALLAGLTTAISAAAQAFANRPAAPAQDNTLMVELMRSQTATAAAAAKAQSDVLVALIGKDPKPDTTALTLLTTVLTNNKPQSMLEVAQALKALGGGGGGGGMKEMVETVKAVREISGPGEGGKSELTELIGGVTALAALDRGDKSKAESKEDPPPRRDREPERQRTVRLRLPGLGVQEVVVTPELLAQLEAAPPTVLPAAAAPAAAPAAAAPAAAAPAAAAPAAAAPAAAAPAAAAPAAAAPAAAAPAAAAPAAAAPPAPPAAPAPSAPATEEDEVAALAHKLGTFSPQDNRRLAALLHAQAEAGAPAGPAAAPPQPAAPAGAAPAAPAQPNDTVEPTAGAGAAAPSGTPAGAAPSSGARRVRLGDVEVEVVEEEEKKREPIRLGPSSRDDEPPTDEELMRAAGMDPRVVERAAVKRFGARAEGLAEAMTMMVAEAPAAALPFLRKAFPPADMRALLGDLG